MATLNVNLSEETWKLLQEKASRYNVSPEDLVRASLEELLSRQDEQFQQVVDYVVGKNAELYRRLATE